MARPHATDEIMAPVAFQRHPYSHEAWRICVRRRRSPGTGATASSRSGPSRACTTSSNPIDIAAEVAPSIHMVAERLLAYVSALEDERFCGLDLRN